MNCPNCRTATSEPVTPLLAEVKNMINMPKMQLRVCPKCKFEDYSVEDE